MPIAIGCAFDALSALLSVKASQHCQYTIGTLYLTHPVPSIHSKFFRLFVRVHSPIILFNQNIKKQPAAVNHFFCKDLTRFLDNFEHFLCISLRDRQLRVDEAFLLLFKSCFIIILCWLERRSECTLGLQAKRRREIQFFNFWLFSSNINCSLPDNKWTNRSQATRIQGRMLTTPSKEFEIQGPHLLTAKKPTDAWKIRPTSPHYSYVRFLLTEILAMPYNSIQNNASKLTTDTKLPTTFCSVQNALYVG